MESFEKLTPNRKHSDLLKQLYDDDIEKLDLLIGCLAEEPRPDGYGFGETAFNIFVLMASRRLKTDRLVISLLTFVHSAGALIKRAQLEAVKRNDRSKYYCVRSCSTTFCRLYIVKTTKDLKKEEHYTQKEGLFKVIKMLNYKTEFAVSL